jgi:hypothetical protein
MKLLKYFIYSNWHLFVILGLDFLTSLNLTNYTNNLSVDETKLLVNFGNLSGNFIFLLAPLGNVSLKLAKQKSSIRYLLIFNIVMVFISSLICKLIINYKADELLESDLNNIYLIFYNLFVSSMLSISNYYLIGTNNINILLKYNIFNMLFNHVIIRYVIQNYSLFNKIIFVNMGDFLSIFYILYNLDKPTNIKELDYYENYQLMIKNSISILSLNINNSITTNMNKYEVKKYQSLSSNFYSYTLLYNPISLAIKKNEFPKKFMTKLCIFYYLAIMVCFNASFYYNNINLSLSNVYLALYYIVLLLESASALNDNVKLGILVNGLVILGKIIYRMFIKIDTMYDYYYFINTFFIVRILLKLYANKN